MSEATEILHQKGATRSTILEPTEAPVVVHPHSATLASDEVYVATQDNDGSPVTLTPAGIKNP